MAAIKVMRQLAKEWTLPDEMKVSWDANNNQEIAHAAKIFSQYLAEGWIAYIDEPKGRKQIFKFDPKTTKIVLMPPLGGG